MPSTISSITTRLETILPKIRFEHSLRVADTAKQLAALANVNQDKAFLAGLIHDTAKPMSPGTLDEYSIKIEDLKRDVYHQYKSVWHALIAPQVVGALFNIDDEEVLDAIEWHTTGKADMKPLTQIVFVADFIEPGRDAVISKEVSEIASKSLDDACCRISEYSIEKLTNKKNKIHPLTIDCYNHYRSTSDTK
jgi:predicted HD superfamily hydrolase involved in NAD metabolism